MDAVTRQTDGQTALAVERMCAPREPKTILLAIQPASPPTLGATLESLAYWHLRLLAVGLAEVGARGLAREVKPARESEQPAVIKRLSYVAPAVWSGDAAWRMLTSDNPRGTKTS